MSISITQLELGPMQNYVYLVSDKLSGETVIIDPGWEGEKIIDFVKKNKLTPKAILVTHGHFDHTGAINVLYKEFQIPVYISESEFNFFKPQNVDLVEVGDKFQLKIGKMIIDFLFTPGHSPGGQCFLINKEYLFTGDTLFLDGCGRWDLPGADKYTLLQSIKTQIRVLNDDVIIYPGHNYHAQSRDTLYNQKKVNECFVKNYKELGA